jgi:hypothetical protein
MVNTGGDITGYHTTTAPLIGLQKAMGNYELYRIPLAKKPKYYNICSADVNGSIESSIIDPLTPYKCRSHSFHNFKLKNSGDPTLNFLWTSRNKARLVHKIKKLDHPTFL